MFTEDQAFSLLKRRIYLDRGLDCEQYKENYLKRRIAVRLRAIGASDYAEYLRVLRTDPDEYTKLLNELTINVTQFFRDKDVFTRLRDEVIPEAIGAKQAISSRSLRTWSAGCASGEEPYSLAMLLDHALGKDLDKWNVRILGSDIDDGSLAIARNARYTEVDMLEGMELQKYFETKDTAEGRQFYVREFIKRRVKLEKINLLEEHGRRHFDMVLCRNVLIYFSRDVQSRIIESLASSMQKDGFLILGKSETLGSEASAYFKPVYPRERIYKLAYPVSATPPARRPSR